MNGLPQFQLPEKYNCEKCRFFTKDLNKYNIHKALHNEMRYVCANCNFEAYSKTEFQRHLISHTGKFPYTCGYCGYGAVRNDYIIKHIKRIHGDGKILCSVSTIENESKNASVNIAETQVRASLQEILPNNITIGKSQTDLTNNVGHSVFNSNLFHLNGTGSSSANGDQVEVELISPIGQQLNPWMPLTVVAPTSFKVPQNCLAEVVEVKPANDICHLVLKCFEVIDSNVPNYGFSKEMHEKNLSESTENYIESSDGFLIHECTQLFSGEDALHALNAITLPEENSSNGLDSSPTKMEMSTTPIEGSDEFLDETEELFDGPIISSVISLSSETQNVIEGIQWESPVTNTNESNDIVEIIAECQGSQVLGTEANWKVESEKSNEHKIAVRSEQPEQDAKKIKNNDPKLETFIKPALPDDKTASAQINKKVEHKSNRFSKIKPFSKPQTLFLSCNKKIVMQPLSCLIKNVHTTELCLEDEHGQCKKIKLPSAKPKSKTIHKKVTKPSPKALRLYPVKSDQLTQLPHRNQPVVVLNHPELESLETFSLMKTIGMFKGKVLKVTLSKQMLKKSCLKKR
ncbi:zinc finger protein 518B [Gastrophryne carolinensis]